MNVLEVRDAVRQVADPDLLPCFDRQCEIDVVVEVRLRIVMDPRDIDLSDRVVPELIGGVRVVVESRMIDSSLAGRLEGMRKTLLAAPLPRADE